MLRSGKLSNSQIPLASAAPIHEEIPMSKYEDRSRPIFYSGFDEDVESQLQQVMWKDEDVDGKVRPSLHSWSSWLSKNIMQLLQGWNFPVFILTISFLQVLLFYTVDSHLLLLLFAYDPHRRHEFWRFLTPMLVHKGKFHLWDNVQTQMILGVILELDHGWMGMGIIYLASVSGGTLFVSVLDPKHYTYGASAGFYGLLFAHISTLILNWDQMGWKWCRLSYLLYMAYDIGSDLWDIIYSEHNAQISHAGHFGGAVTGILASVLFLRILESLWKVRMERICKVLLISGFIGIVLINLSCTSYYAKEEWHFDYEYSYANLNLRLIVESAEDSPLRRSCQQDLNCKIVLEQYYFNGTLPF